MSAAEIFASFQEHLDKEKETREHIRQCVQNVELVGQKMYVVYQQIHQPDGLKQLAEICQRGQTHFVHVQQLLKHLSDAVPADQYYRFHDHWRFIMQRLCCLSALNAYLSTSKLITLEETADCLGLTSSREKGFHLDLDDYLMGLLQMTNELSRWAVNAAAAGDYQRPFALAQFMSELDGGFRLLNLKNDSLRKKFDGLKYDLKKVEEVKYDVSIRGLRPAAGDTA